MPDIDVDTGLNRVLSGQAWETSPGFGKGLLAGFVIVFDCFGGASDKSFSNDDTSLLRCIVRLRQLCRSGAALGRLRNVWVNL